MLQAPFPAPEQLAAHETAEKADAGMPQFFSLVLDTSTVTFRLASELRKSQGEKSNPGYLLNREFLASHRSDALYQGTTLVGPKNAGKRIGLY
jgi:hypothetical protein